MLAAIYICIYVICIRVGKVHTLEERLRDDKKEWHEGKRTPEAFHGGYVNSTFWISKQQ